MKLCPAFLSLCLFAAPATRADIQTDWAYHAIGSASRMSERVPGEEFHFLANGTDQVSDADTVTLYLLTAPDFAGDMDEQIYVRWWDGAMSHWIMGSWIKNVTLDAARPETCLRGLPTEGTVTLDLWKIEIPPWITQAGDNFYAIQLKGYAQESTDERYLLNQPGGDFSQTNNLGQAWSASEEFDGQDWKVQITP
jgi:hypothetical protein